jgi:hypothetical protein
VTVGKSRVEAAGWLYQVAATARHARFAKDKRTLPPALLGLLTWELAVVDARSWRSPSLAPRTKLPAVTLETIGLYAYVAYRIGDGVGAKDVTSSTPRRGERVIPRASMSTTGTTQTAALGHASRLDPLSPEIAAFKSELGSQPGISITATGATP